jgi:cardiolipin synthase
VENSTRLGVASSNWTIPNALSGLRLLGVPVFFWLIVVPENDGLALVVLIVSSFTDWLDGFLARKLNQFSRLGELLDPLADRLYVVAAMAALFIRDLLPIWVVILLVLRDVLMSLLLVYLKRLGFTGVPVHFVGKAATMNLLYALPLVLLGTFGGLIGQISHIFGWAFLIWGITMYWYAGALYCRQVFQMRRVGNAR